MFVQSKAETNHSHKNGVAIRQRLASKETLVQWENGRRHWVETSDLQGKVVLIGNSGLSDNDWEDVL